MNDDNVLRNSKPRNIAANPMDNSSDISNSSSSLHSSHDSTVLNECDLSLLSLSLDNEVEADVKAIDIDELPAFEIRLISPLGRTPSPIDSEDMATPTRPPPIRRLIPSPCRNNPEFVALHDINAQIIPPSDNGDEIESSLNRTSSLETIFEGVFLHTPPRHLSLQNNRSRKVALSRLNVGKENLSPLNKSEPQTSSIALRCMKDSCMVFENHNFS